MTDLRLAKLGTLNCRVLQADPAQRPKLVVVLCHGFGAPGDDLVALGPELMERFPLLAKHARFIFPEAPIALPHFGNGRAWWEIDLEERLQAQSRGGAALEALLDQAPPGLVQARRAVMSLVDALQREGFAMGSIVLGGFSQGAMVATDATLALEEATAGLAILSGTLINRKDWAQKLPRRANLPVFQSHGRQDPVLRFEDAVALGKLLETSGLRLQSVSFNGGHGIPLEVLEGLGKFLEARLPSGP